MRSPDFAKCLQQNGSALSIPVDSNEQDSLLSEALEPEILRISRWDVTARVDAFYVRRAAPVLLDERS
jgi:hypothetical protein